MLSERDEYGNVSLRLSNDKDSDYSHSVEGKITTIVEHIQRALVLQHHEDCERCTPRDMSSSAYYEDGDSEYDFNVVTTQQYINKVQEPLKVYQGIVTKKMHYFPESFKLFRTLYSYWKGTGKTSIVMSDLGSLLRAEDLTIFKEYPSPQLTMFLIRARGCKFPFKWNCKKGPIDFQQMVDAIENKDDIDHLVAAFHSAF